MFMSRPERYRHGLRKARRFTALKKELNLRYVALGRPPERSKLLGRIIATPDNKSPFRSILLRGRNTTACGGSLHELRLHEYLAAES